MTDERQTFRAAFADLEKTFGRPMRFDGNGACVITLSRETSVVVQDLPARSGAVVWAIVTGLPDDERAAERARYLLEAQDCGGETDGFSYALDPESRRLILRGLVAYGDLATGDAIAERLESFLEILERTRRELASRWPSDADADTEWEVG